MITTRVFCIGENIDNCHAGSIETLTPVCRNQQHTIKDRAWVVANVGTNFEGEPVADLIPVTPNLQESNSG